MVTMRTIDLKKNGRNNMVRADRIACAHVRKMWLVVTKIL